MQQLTGQDASFLYVENESIKSHFTMLMIYDQSDLGVPLRYRDILSHFEERVAGLPIFRRKLYPVPLGLDHPYFADDPNFHIEAHVRHIALPQPGDWRQFCILAAQIQASPIEMSKPLWDMHIIGGLEKMDGIPPNSFAILLRVHHAIADGTTARGILGALTHPAGKVPPPLPTAAPQAPPSMGDMAVRGAINNARQWSDVSNRLVRLLPGASEALARRAGQAVENWLESDGAAGEIADDGRIQVPATIFNGEMEYRRVFQSRRYPLKDISRIRGLVPGATLNDVVLTLIGGGMKRYLAAQGEQHDIDLVALCPVNLREDKAAADSTQGNNISLMKASLFTRSGRPAQRLAKVMRGTSAGKLMQKASTAKELIAMAKSAPNLLLAAGTRLAMLAAIRNGPATRMANCIITNVPGPQEPVYFMGARLELMTAVAPLSPGTGITFPVSSYCGQLCISFTACPSWVADPQGLADCLDESFAELVHAASKTARVPLRRKPRKPTRRRPANS